MLSKEEAAKLVEAYRSAYWDYYYNGNDLSRDRLDGAIGQLLAALMQGPCNKLQDAITWALGAGDDFRPRRDGDGPYWWRKELAERAGAKWDGEKYVFDGSIEPNHPKGPGVYYLTQKVYVIKNDDGSISVWTNNRLPTTYMGDISHITGHWQPIDTPDKESLNNSVDEQTNKILNICGYYD